MKSKIYQNQDSSSTGYAPTIQSTTGTFCVTQSSTRSSGDYYSENISETR